MKKRIALLMAALLIVSLVPVLGTDVQEAVADFAGGIALFELASSSSTPPAVSPTPPAITPTPPLPPSPEIGYPMRRQTRRSSTATTGDRYVSAAVSIAGQSIEVSGTGNRVNFEISNAEARDIIAALEGNTLDLSVAGMAGFSNVREIRVPRAALERFANAGISIEFGLPQGSLRLNPEAILSITSVGANPYIAISLSEPSAGRLTSNQRSAARNSDLITKLQISTGLTQITTFNGNAVITLPISAPASAYIIDEIGTTTPIQTTGNLSFNTTQTGVFAIFR